MKVDITEIETTLPLLDMSKQYKRDTRSQYIGYDLQHNDVFVPTSDLTNAVKEVEVALLKLFTNVESCLGVFDHCSVILIFKCNNK